MRAKIRAAIESAPVRHLARRSQPVRGATYRVTTRLCATAYRLLLEEQKSDDKLGLPFRSQSDIVNDALLAYLGRGHR